MLPEGQSVTVFPYFYLYKACISLLAAMTLFQLAGVNRLTIALSIPEFLAIFLQIICYFTPFSRDIHELVFASMRFLYENYSNIHLTLFLSQLVIIGLLLLDGVIRRAKRLFTAIMDSFSASLRDSLGAR